MTYRPQKGFALLAILLIAASIMLAVSLAASTAGALAGNRLRAYSYGAEARMILMQCAENLLYQVRSNPAITGSGTLSNIQGGSCTYTISGTSPTKTIVITAQDNNLYRRLTITTSAVSPRIIATWIEGS